jgi:hypothetical protein
MQNQISLFVPEGTEGKRASSVNLAADGRARDDRHSGE